MYNVEVGARGFVAFSLRKFLSKFGIKSRGNARICANASNVAARCSYAIYLAHSSVEWLRTKPLLEPDGLENNLSKAFEKLSHLIDCRLAKVTDP